jgi:hypothetical protein
MVAILLGGVYGLLVFGYDVSSAVDGIVAGLTAVGLYRTGQKIVQ